LQAHDRFRLAIGNADRHIDILRPAKGQSGLARVLTEVLSLADARQLHRLKMCNSHECHWIFFDRSKPGNRRWCSSSRCGNRQKTRDYCERVKAKSA
jgi:predicted RNA-binding Zn ribbon-like protein